MYVDLNLAKDTPTTDSDDKDDLKQNGNTTFQPTSDKNCKGDC